MVTNHSLNYYCVSFQCRQFGDEFGTLQFFSLYNRCTINFLVFEPSDDQTLGPLEPKAAIQKPWRSPHVP